MEDILPGKGPPAVLGIGPTPEMEVETAPSLEVVTLEAKGQGTHQTMLDAISLTEGLKVSLLVGLLATRREPRRPEMAGRPLEVAQVSPAGLILASCATAIQKWWMVSTAEKGTTL
jgi:hypothetical protein